MFLGDEHVEGGDNEANGVSSDCSSAGYEDEGEVPEHGGQAGHKDRAVVPTALAAPWCGSTIRKTNGRAAAPSGA